MNKRRDDDDDDDETVLKIIINKTINLLFLNCDQQQTITAPPLYCRVVEKRCVVTTNGYIITNVVYSGDATCYQMTLNNCNFCRCYFPVMITCDTIRYEMLF